MSTIAIQYRLSAREICVFIFPPVLRPVVSTWQNLTAPKVQALVLLTLIYCLLMSLFIYLQTSVTYRPPTIYTGETYENSTEARQY